MEEEKEEVTNKNVESQTNVKGPGCFYLFVRPWAREFMCPNFVCLCYGNSMHSIEKRINKKPATLVIFRKCAKLLW